MITIVNDVCESTNYCVRNSGRFLDRLWWMPNDMLKALYKNNVE